MKKKIEAYKTNSDGLKYCNEILNAAVATVRPKILRLMHIYMLVLISIIKP